VDTNVSDKRTVSIFRAPAIYHRSIRRYIIDVWPTLHSVIKKVRNKEDAMGQRNVSRDHTVNDKKLIRF
jgi:hypothetical protein